MRRATGHCKVSTILGLRRSLRVSELERGVSVDLGWPRAWRPIEYCTMVSLLMGVGLGGRPPLRAPFVTGPQAPRRQSWVAVR